MLGLPPLPIPSNVFVFIGLGNALEELRRTRKALGDVEDGTDRQQWTLALEGLEERIGQLRELARS